MGVGGIDGTAVHLASPSNSTDVQAAASARRVVAAVSETAVVDAATSPNVVSKTAQNPHAGNEQHTDAEDRVLQEAVEQTQQFVNMATKDIQFVIDNRFDTMVVKVVDSKTKEVIRQIPSEEMLSMAKALEKLQGLLVRQKA